MVRLPAFLEVLADLDGRRRETFEEVAMVLRRAGQLPPTKRGRGATAVDDCMAANLLLAAMADAAPSACPRSVQIYRSLRQNRGSRTGAVFPSLQGVLACESFGEAVEVLLSQGLKLKADMLKILTSAYPNVPDDQVMNLQALELELAVSRPWPSARLVVRGLDHNNSSAVAVVAQWDPDVHLVMEGFYRPELIASVADKRTETVVSHRAIFTLAQALKGVKPSVPTAEAA